MPFRVEHGKEDRQETCPALPGAVVVLTRCGRCVVWPDVLPVGGLARFGVYLVPWVATRYLECWMCWF